MKCSKNRGVQKYNILIKAVPAIKITDTKVLDYIETEERFIEPAYSYMTSPDVPLYVQ